jgi:hypothetical protein
MLRTCQRLLCGFLLSFVAAVVASAQHMMSDPLFGIAYDPQRVHFERMPARLTQACKELRGRYVAAWSYGHFRDADAEYFLIAGLMEFHSEEPGGPTSIAPEEGEGLLVELSASRCYVNEANWSTPEEVAEGATPAPIPLAVMNGLLSDAFKKYATAFGGKQEFLKHIMPGVAWPRVQQQLDIFAKGPS